MHDDTFETTRDRYNDLVTRIEEARAAYYDRDAPTISDADYDRMSVSYTHLTLPTILLV